MNGMAVGNHGLDADQTLVLLHFHYHYGKAKCPDDHVSVRHIDAFIAARSAIDAQAGRSAAQGSAEPAAPSRLS